LPIEDALLGERKASSLALFVMA
jgi:hypothetical protein